MARKPTQEERQIILARDHRRRYGARLVFRVLHTQHIGTLENATLLLPDGPFAHIQKKPVDSWEYGIPYELLIEGYATAAEAEAAGMQAAQALLLTAISLDFGIRLDYSNHQPPTVFDRTASSGLSMSARLIQSWPEVAFVQELTIDFAEKIRDRKMLLSMELLASSTLEANDRARFVTAVSAFEPLATRAQLGQEVADFVDRVLTQLRTDTAVPTSVRPSLEGRVHQLKRESIRQALARLSGMWFPGDTEARTFIDYVYRLRSEILHEGKVNDPDILLGNETRRAQTYLRRIYEQEFKQSFRAPTAA